MPRLSALQMRQIRRRLFGLKTAAEIVDRGVLRDKHISNSDLYQMTAILEVVARQGNLPWPPKTPAPAEMGLINAPEPDEAPLGQFPPKAPRAVKVPKQAFPRRRA
jgi:hypothetical protein